LTRVWDNADVIQLKNKFGVFNEIAYFDYWTSNALLLGLGADDFDEFLKRVPQRDAETNAILACDWHSNSGQATGSGIQRKVG